MNIGKLRHLVSLQNYYTSRNAVGEVIKVWTTYATAWASISPVSGSQFKAGEQEDSETTHSITLRYNGTVSNLDRIVFNSETYEVLSSIDYDNRKTYIIIKAKQIHPEGDDSYVINASGHSSELGDYVTESEGFNFLDTDNWLLYTRNDISYPAGGGEPDTYYFDAPLTIVPEETAEATSHLTLNGLQGGTGNEYYHLTQTQHDTLTDGSNADSLHIHTHTSIPAHNALSGLNVGDYQHLTAVEKTNYETHIALTDEHIDWTNATDNLTTTGNISCSNISGAIGSFSDDVTITGFGNGVYLPQAGLIDFHSNTHRIYPDSGGLNINYTGTLYFSGDSSSIVFDEGVISTSAAELTIDDSTTINGILTATGSAAHFLERTFTSLKPKGSIVMKNTTTLALADGIGAGYETQIQGLEGVPYTIGRIGTMRDGHDHSGKYFVTLWKAGVRQDDVFTVDADGNANFNGTLEFGTHTSLGAETVTGYITITDSGGTTRKLAVVS